MLFVTHLQQVRDSQVLTPLPKKQFLDLPHLWADVLQQQVHVLNAHHVCNSIQIIALLSLISPLYISWLMLWLKNYIHALIEESDFCCRRQSFIVVTSSIHSRIDMLTIAFSYDWDHDSQDILQSLSTLSMVDRYKISCFDLTTQLNRKLTFLHLIWSTLTSKKHKPEERGRQSFSP